MAKLISNITFTKNRPLQLDAYLASLYRHFPAELIQTYVIYKVELFPDEYESLFRKFPEVQVIREGDFHADCMSLLNRIDTKYILFGIDDVVVFDSVRFEVIDEAFAEFRDDIFGFTLRFSPASLADSGDDIEECTVVGEQVYRLDWRKGRTRHTQYPFELCCTFYRTELVKTVIRNSMSSSVLAAKLFQPSSPLIKALGPLGLRRSTLKRFGYFFSPNKLESWPCRWCRNHGDQLPGFTYFQNMCATAIQVNMVNTSTRNAHCGTVEHTVEALNEKYKQEYVLDIDFVAAGKPTQPGSGPELFRLCKTRPLEKVPAVPSTNA